MVKIVDMTSALQQVREKAEFRISYSDKFGKHAGFEDGNSLQDIQNKAQKLRAKGFKIDKMGRNTSPVSEELSMKATFLNGDDKTFKGKTASDINKQVKEYEKKHNTGLQHDGPMVKEDLNKDDESVVKKVRDMLKGASDKHKSQAKVLDKALKSENEKDLEEQKKELEEQLKTAEKELEELYIKEDKAYVIRFQRIADKERMVVVFRNQHDADMYADNIKKQGGQVFSNKLEKIPYKVVGKK